MVAKINVRVKTLVLQLMGNVVQENRQISYSQAQLHN
jgi:hypothetical protein